MTCCPHPTGPDGRLLDQHERLAWNIIPSNTDPAKLPAEAKDRLDKCLHAQEAMSRADGHLDLLQIVRLLENQLGCDLTPKDIKEIVSCCRSLAASGHVEVKYRTVLDKDDICKALRQCGLSSGDVVFVHSSLSVLGYVAGGAKTVIDALIAVVGSGGILAMPTFYDVAVFAVTECGIKRRYPPKPPHTPIPYDPGKSRAHTGVIPNAFWPRHDVVRSAHPTHSVAAFGGRASWFVEGHGPGKPAFARNGPFGKLVDSEGYFLFLGAPLSSMTFLHVLEDWLKLPYMPTASVRIMANGKEETATAPKYPEGHRSFYLPEPNKVTKAIAEAGIEFASAQLGLAEILLVRAHDICEKLSPRMRREPDLLLCDNSECIFCAWAREQLRK